MYISFFGKPKDSDLPHITVHRTKEGTVFEIVAALLLVIMWAIIATMYGSLPENISTHFDLSGHANATGNKLVLIVVGITGTLTVAAMLITCYFPRHINMNIKQPTVAHYKIGIRMLRTIGVEVALMFVFIVLQMTGTFPPSGSLQPLIPLITCIAIVATVILFKVLLHRV